MKLARDTDGPRWLLLIHQIPPKPGYFRAKVGRRLQRLGAVALKNSVYVLPFLEQAQEDLQWVAREILEEGGDATLCAARLIEGLRNEQVEAMFHVARESDYAQLTEEAEQARGELGTGALEYEQRVKCGADLARLKKRLSAITAIDFFAAPGRRAAQGAVDAVETRLRPRSAPSPKGRRLAARYSACTWVTRKNVHVDRIASAWLIQRFIDVDATFKFVPANGYVPEKGELRFDMDDGEFTHVGDHCSFEVLLERGKIEDPALMAIAEIVHDIDLRDEKFGREETAGVRSQITGVCAANRDDLGRIASATAIFESLYSFFSLRSRG